MSLYIVPMELDEANEFVRQYHRTHKPATGHKFSIGVADGEGQIRGVAIVGRPVARMADDGWTLEVIRTCTDGAKNANSMLYGACWRAAKAMGYKRLGTYTLKCESGASLKAAGWQCLGEAGGGSWSRGKRPRVDKHPLQEKLKWMITENSDILDSELLMKRITAGPATESPVTAAAQPARPGSGASRDAQGTVPPQDGRAVENDAPRGRGQSVGEPGR